MPVDESGKFGQVHHERGHDALPFIMNRSFLPMLAAYRVKGPISESLMSLNRREDCSDLNISYIKILNKLQDDFARCFFRGFKLSMFILVFLSILMLVVQDSLAYSVSLNPTMDTYLNKGSVNTNYGTATSLYIVTSSSEKRTLVKFDLSGIPSGAVITSSIFSIYVSTPSTSQTGRIYRLTRSWTETGATWNKYGGTGSWTTVGGDYDTGTIWGSFSSLSSSGYKTSDINNLVKNWYGGQYQNYGFIIIGPTSSQVVFNSDEGSNRPKLDITYNLPSISISKTVLPSSGSPGTNVDFKIRVTNTGDVALNPVSVEDTLPTGLTYVSNNRSGSVNGKTITWSNLGSLSSGSFTTIDLVASIDGAQDGNIINSVTATGTPPTGSNVVSSTTATVQALHPSVSITKTALPTQGSPGTNVDFKIRVTNTGNVALNPVSVVDALPIGLTYVSDNKSGTVNGKTITWSNVGSLSSGSFATIDLVASIDGAQYGTLTNSVSATGTPPTGSNAVSSTIATVQALHSSISVTKTASPNQGSPGTNVDFKIRVTNTGDVTLNYVSVSDFLPTGITYVSDNKSGTVNGKQISWSVGSLSSGSFATIDLVASIDGTQYGTLGNSVGVAGTPPTGTSVSSGTTATVQALSPGVSITKTPSPNQGSPGMNVNFGITVRNTGGDTLNTVKVVDVLPAGLIYISDNKSGTVDGKTITWNNVGPLSAGSSASIGLVAQIDGTQLGTVTNTVNVTGIPPTGNSVGSLTTAGVLVQEISDSDLTGDSGDFCTDVTSTYSFTKDGPGLTYQWYLGPINANPATQIISGYYTGGITPSSITSRTSSLDIAWASLVPQLKDSFNQAVPPNSGTFTVTLKITQGGTFQKTISKTVNLVPKPSPVITFNP